MRLRRLTRKPCDSHRRRTSRLRPSRITTRNQVWLPPRLITAISSKRAGPSSSSTPRLQALDDLVGHFAVHAAEVFALELRSAVHQRVGQFAVGGQQQQAGGVDVQAADGDPARTLQARQLFEHGRAAFGIVAGGHHAFGLVVDQHFGLFAAVGGDDELLAVQLDAVAGVHAHAERRRARR